MVPIPSTKNVPIILLHPKLGFIVAVSGSGFWVLGVGARPDREETSGNLD